MKPKLFFAKLSRIRDTVIVASYDSNALGKKSTPDLTVSVSSNPEARRLIQNPCIPHKTIVRHNIVTRVVVEEDSFI